MAWVPLAAMAVGTVMQANGQRSAANAQATALDQQAQQTDERAALLVSQGKQSARRYREQGQANVGQANAAMAASGVDVSQGTAADVRSKITQNSEQDALNAILSADENATNLQQTAANTRMAAADARNAGNKSALATIFKGAGSAYSIWKK